ncbi:hypothetical protein B566_EDAN012615 [Ephemera danica]|nr:hypothetical protein B566_EDAN012615 [Ephemera danica]
MHHKIVNNFDYARVQMPGENNGFGIEALMIAIKEYNLEIMKFIILCNPIVVNVAYAKDYKCMTPLMTACYVENYDAVTYLLTRRKCIVNIVNESGKSVLHYASENKNIQILKLLIEHDPTLLNKKDFDASTALHAACKSDKYEAAKHLLIYSNCLVNIEDSMSKPAIHYAVQSGNIEIIKLLLTRDHKMLEVHDVLAATLLHAAVKHKKIEVVEFLIKECKCPINVVDWYKRTALHYAAEVGNKHIVKFLIQQDQSLMNRQDCHGMTALHLACQSGKFEVVKCLLFFSDCLVNVQDILLKNAIHYLIEASFDISIETIKLLLERDITLLNEQDIDGDTALHIACYQGNIQLVKHLISYRCRLVHSEYNFLENSSLTDFISQLVHSCCDRTLLNMQNGYGMTPLHKACKSKKKDTIQFLLSLLDCDVNVVDSTGKCAIHYAASMDNALIISHLLEKDYTLLNKQDFEGNTPLNIACRNNRIGVSHLLLSYPDCVVNLENILNSIQPAKFFNIPQQLKVVELILQRDHSLLNKQSEDGTTPLLFACKNGKAEIAEFLLSHPDCVVNFEDTAKRNSLHYAAENGHTEVLKIILGKDRSVLNKQDKNGMTALHIACKKFWNEATKFLLSYEDCSVYFQDEKKRFAIHYAAKNLREEILQNMLERDHTLLNKQDKNGMTPLHFSCFYNCAAAEFLLSLTECDVSILDKKNRSALHYSMDKYNIGVSKLILERDFSLLNKQDIDGNTPLHLACKSGRTIEYLLSLSDCLINVKNNMKRTPLDYAYQFCINSLDMTPVELFLERDNTLLDKQDIKIETLMKTDCYWYVEAEEVFTNFIIFMNHKYFKIDLKDDNGNTLFHAIANLDKFTSPYLMNILLERNPQLLNMQNKNFQTALHFAAKKHNFKVLNFLLNLTECNVSVKDDNGDTALHIYVHLFDEDHGCVDVQTGNSNFVRYLIYLGADTDIKDKNGNTPLDLARQLQDLSRKHRIVNYLQNK